MGLGAVDKTPIYERMSSSNYFKRLNADNEIENNFPYIFKISY